MAEFGKERTGGSSRLPPAAASHLQGAELLHIYMDEQNMAGRGGVWAHSPGSALPVRALSRAAAVADVVAVDGDELLPAFGGLLLLSKLVVLPAALVLPQLPVSCLGSENSQKDVQRACSAGNSS